jgi:cell division protein FtsL
MNQTDKLNPFFDIDTYINHLEKTIEEQKSSIESLEKEISNLRIIVGLLDNEKWEEYLDK